MKVLSIIGLMIALIGLGAGIYCQIEIVPNYNYFDVKIELSEMERALWRSYGDQKFIIGSVALFLGPLAMIIGLITGIKKQKIGWIALTLGLVSFVLGAMQSTHLFN